MQVPKVRILSFNEFNELKVILIITQSLNLIWTLPTPSTKLLG